MAVATTFPLKEHTFYFTAVSTHTDRGIAVPVAIIGEARHFWLWLALPAVGILAPLGQSLPSVLHKRQHCE